MPFMQKVAVTGPTGEIGSAFVQFCLDAGLQVLAICRPGSARAHILPKHKNLRTVACALDQLDSFDAAQAGQQDVFFHLGWADTFVSASRNDLVPQLLNVKYAIEAVRLAKRLGCEAFVGAGSQAEYGRSAVPLRPDSPCHPENGYGMAKLCAGQMTRLECHTLGLRHIWPRFFSVYGPEDRTVAMIPSIIASCLAGVSPKLTAGEQLWDYLYSRDVAESLYLMGQKGRDGAIYTVGCGKPRQIREYVEIICKMANSAVKPEFGAVPYAKSQVMFLCADIEAAQKDLGWQPNTSFEQGIAWTIDWHKNIINK